ncbi:MAG: DoxX family membrane protein [Gemmatimonadaceae bacterium]|nr:DoxX family membrane protein [Gemmatimonadaceae bacterium]
MQRASLLLLRISLGGLMVYWGIDKLINVTHGITVAQKFYGGAAVATVPMQAFGALQVVLGVAVILGVGRRVSYPALLLVTGTTLLAVWKSIVDPFKLVVEGGNLIFYPSLIIFAAAVVLLAFRAADTLALDARRRRA